ncbi:nuclease-related domain-containing protein [Streptomyces sp. NPDC048595]|uniref:nuclease-related domain-containing protein n=1 Tax=Streptomyces sp. NPDC048595 TaxID=3365576 RepID=UPI00371E7E60
MAVLATRTARAALAAVTGYRETAVDTAQSDLASNKPGEALRRKLAELEPKGIKRLTARWSSDLEVRSWAHGLVGERITGRRLNKLRRQGWRVLHAVQWPSGSDIDHLVIGPPGVFTINSKRHSGKTVWYGDHALTRVLPADTVTRIYEVARRAETWVPQ